MKNKKEKNERLQAAAIKYDAAQDPVPYLVGIGQGAVAEKMVQTAQEHDIPIVEDQVVAKALQGLGIGDDIPEELYQVIAEVLIFVARLDDETGKKFGLK